MGAFGAAKVKVPDGVTSKLEIVSEHSFNDSKKPGVLKWTLSGLRKNSESIDSDCYLYFPYEKDSQATAANSYGSALCEWGFNNGNNINGLLTLGDVIVNSEGQAEINDGGVGVSSYDVMKRGCGVQRHLYGKNLAAYNDVEDKEYGLGLRFSMFGAGLGVKGAAIATAIRARLTYPSMDGTRMPAKMPRMAMTTMISTNVKPFTFRFIMHHLFLM